jgi:hypothetical protein
VIFDGNEQGENIQVEFFSLPASDRVRMRRNAKLLDLLQNYFYVIVEVWLFGTAKFNW